MIGHRSMIELYNNVLLFITRFTSLLGSSLVISAPGYKYARSICLLTWKGHLALSSLAVPEDNPFPARSFLPFRLSHEYLVREQPRGPLSRFPHDSSPQSAGYFSLLQPGLRILATCHCPCNDHAVCDSTPWGSGITSNSDTLLSSKCDWHYEIIFTIYPFIYFCHQRCTRVSWIL